MEVWGGSKRLAVTHRRYSEFHAMMGRVGRAAEAPFPPKTWFVSLEPAFLEERRQLLEAWLDSLLRSEQSVAKLPCVREFLQLDAPAPALSAPAPLPTTDTPVAVS